MAVGEARLNDRPVLSLGAERVLIADDHAMFRFGIGQFLRKRAGVSHVVEAGTFDEALECLRREHMDLAIFDLYMPGITGASDLRLVRDLRPDLKIVVLTACEVSAAILAALAAGVNGYILKGDRTEAILQKLAYVLSGEVYVPPTITHGSPPETPTPATEDRVRLATLSTRQKEIALLMTQGKSNKEIANELRLSPATVKTHLATIYDLLGVKNRAQAAALIRQN